MSDEFYASIFPRRARCITASVSGAAPTTAPVTIPALQRQNLNTNMYKIYKIYKI